MKKMILSAVVSVVMVGFLASCASTPKASTETATATDAKAWLSRYCSLANNASQSTELFGSLFMKARTQEIKGQYPASLHYDKNGSFQLEVTSIIGGTLVQLLGDRPGPNQSLEIKSPSKPKYNRQGITHYLGVDASILTQLLHGDLPCPSLSQNKVTVDGTRLVIETSNWKWLFTRASLADQEVPVEVQLVPLTGATEGKTIDMQIKEWDLANHYAKKVFLKTPEGEILWSWRSRELK